jgi:hypothetical protein
VPLTRHCVPSIDEFVTVEPFHAIVCIANVYRLVGNKNAKERMSSGFVKAMK